MQVALLQMLTLGIVSSAIPGLVSVVVVRGVPVVRSVLIVVPLVSSLGVVAAVGTAPVVPVVTSPSEELASHLCSLVYTSTFTLNLHLRM